MPTVERCLACEAESVGAAEPMASHNTRVTPVYLLSLVFSAYNEGTSVPPSGPRSLVSKPRVHGTCLDEPAFVTLGGDPFGLASSFAKASEDKSEAALHGVAANFRLIRRTRLIQ